VSGLWPWGGVNESTVQQTIVRLTREGLIKSLKIPQGRPKAKALGYQPRSLWATCGVAEATPFRNRDLIRGSLEQILNRYSLGEIPSGAKEGAEKVASWRKDVPQRLKPHCKQGSCGTAEAVPLSKTDFFCIL